MILAATSVMANTNYGELRQLFETFTRVWEAGGQTSLHLHTLDGQARTTLNIQLGPPANPRPGAPDVGGERPGPAHRPHHQAPPQQQRPRRRGPSARARDAARREAWLLKRDERQQDVSDTAAATPADTATESTGTKNTVQPNATVTSLPSSADNDVMPQEVQSQVKCAICGFDSKSQRGLRTHMGHKHKDLKESEILREDNSKDKSLDLSETKRDRDELSLPLANSTLHEEPSQAEVEIDDDATELVTDKGTSPEGETLKEDIFMLNLDLEYWTWPQNKPPPLKVHHPQEGLGISPNLYTDALGFDQISYRFKTGVCDVFEIT